MYCRSWLLWTFTFVMLLKRAVWPEVDVDWEGIGFVCLWSSMSYVAIVDLVEDYKGD